MEKEVTASSAAARHNSEIRQCARMGRRQHRLQFYQLTDTSLALARHSSRRYRPGRDVTRARRKGRRETAGLAATTAATCAERFAYRQATRRRCRTTTPAARASGAAGRSDAA